MNDHSIKSDKRDENKEEDGKSFFDANLSSSDSKTFLSRRGLRFNQYFFVVGTSAQWVARKPQIYWWRSVKAESFWSETAQLSSATTYCALGKQTWNDKINWRISRTNVVYFREDTKVSHYIINKIQQGEQIVYRIGDQSFSDLPELLAFYKLHYLDTTPLRRPAQKKVEKVIGKFDFDGSVSFANSCSSHLCTNEFSRLINICFSGLVAASPNR